MHTKSWKISEKVAARFAGTKALQLTPSLLYKNFICPQFRAEYSIHGWCLAGGKAGFITCLERDSRMAKRDGKGGRCLGEIGMVDVGGRVFSFSGWVFELLSMPGMLEGVVPPWPPHKLPFRDGVCRGISNCFRLTEASFHGLAQFLPIF
jgi:hypothetical protein